MGSLEEQLVAAGNSLLQPPSPVDELLLLLDQVESCLGSVEQSPSKSMQMALSPCTKALVSDELLRHPDADVKVAVASCISEITRITAPDAPYDDNQMKDVFQLIVSSFESLSDKSSRSYQKRTLILETVAKVRLCVVMLDLECDGLIIEMFQHFLKAIRDYHPEHVFSSMETIMTIVLEESEEISFELISPLLASVKKDNQEVLPIARKLGKRVFEKCSLKLKPYLIQAKICMGLSLDDYSKIISSICDVNTAGVGRHDDNTCGEQMAEENKLADATSNDAAQDQVNKESITETCPEDHCGDSSPKSVMSNGLAEVANEDRLADPESSKKPEHAQQAGQSIDTNAQPDYLDSGKIKQQSKVKKTSKKRRRKPNSSVKSAEPSDRVDGDKDAKRTEDQQNICSEDTHKHSFLSEGTSAGMVVPSENEKETVQLSSPKASEGEAMNVASPTPSGGVSHEGRPRKAGRWKKKENFITGASKETPLKASKGAIDTEVKPQKRSRKKVHAGGTPGEKTTALAETFKSEDGTASDSEGQTLKQLSRKKVDARYSIGDGSSSKKEDGKRHGHRKATSEKDATKASTKDGAKEVVSSPKTASKLAKDEGHLEGISKALSKRKRTAEEGKALDAMEYGANLVGAKVKVWWPEDEKFYRGGIVSFDKVKKKHTVLYTDGEVEVLDLRKEKWEFASDFKPDGEQATECQSPDPSPEIKKKAKTNSKSAAKQGKMEVSRGGEISLSKLKGSATKAGRISKHDTPKSDGRSEDDKEGKKSKDPSKKSSSKIGVASRTPGKSKDDVDEGTPKISTKSKQEIPKTASKNSPKTSTKSKGKGSKSGDTPDANGSSKAKSASGKGKESKGNDKSPEIVKTPEEDKKSGKKRQRGAKS